MIHILISLAIFWMLACTIRASIFIIWIVRCSRIESPHQEYPEYFIEWLMIYIGAWFMILPAEISGYYGYLCDHINPNIGASHV